MTGVSVAELSAEDRSKWIDYLSAKPEATLFHDLRWLDAVQSAYRYESLPLVAKRSGAIVGALPLTFVAAPLLGRSLVSTAFAVGGGVVADDEEAWRALAAAALEIGRQRRVRHVELRGGPAPGAGYVERSGVYASFVKRLPDDPAAILQWLPRNRRAEVRKALRLDQSAEYTFRLTESVDDFYAVYAAALRNLGTPVMPLRFLSLLKANFGADIEISLMKDRAAPMAGLLSFWRRDRVMPYYIGGEARARDIRAYDYLYYSLMRRAVERGVKLFDFGRSKIGSTQFDTKTYWGFEPTPLVYHVGLVTAKAAPNLTPNNPKFAAMVSVWRRLPLPVANALGPVVARNFP